MRARDIQNQSTWVRQVQVHVDGVGAPQETEYGFCQAIDVTFAQNVKHCINYFFEDLTFAVDPKEIGKQFYDIKWIDDYFKCKPAEAKKEVEFDDNGPDWFEINLGKCRTQITKSVLNRTSMPKPNSDGEQEMAKRINRWARFCMKGTIE